MKAFKLFPLLILLYSVASCRAYYIPTGSMEDTLHIGDHLFARYLFMYKPERGDLVVFKMPLDEDKDYIKRVIAIPGDRFTIKDNHVYINNKIILEPYAKGLTKTMPTSQDFNKKIYDSIVPDRKVIVLGDNRENSLDSRHFGYVDKSKISWKAFLLYWNTSDFLNKNFSRMGLLR
jgi:signal peptidase I